MIPTPIQATLALPARLRRRLDRVAFRGGERLRAARDWLLGDPLAGWSIMDGPHARFTEGEMLAFGLAVTLTVLIYVW